MSDDNDKATGLRVVHGTDDPAVVESLLKQIDYLAGELARVEARMPSADELEYLRQTKLDSDRASWAWQVIKRHAPWVAAVGAMCGSVAWWILTHTVNISPKP